MNYLLRLALLLAVSGAAYGFAMESGTDSAPEGVRHLQQQWAIDNYRLAGDAQNDSFKALIDEADALVAQFPEDASLYVWRGIIKSSYAGISGGLGALKYAKSAKADFERGIALDGAVLQGSAYTSLGTLYSKVPGWPLGFGDSKKAGEMLRKGLELNPAGIDANYFYGQFLSDEGDYAAAEKYYNHALEAPPREGRELADAERRREVEEALAEIRPHLH